MQWWIQDLQKGGGHKILDLLSLLPHIYKLNKTKTWEVVKTSASPKRPFFFFRLDVIFPIFIAFPVQIVNVTYLFIIHSLIQKRGDILYMHIHFPIGTRPHLTKKGGHVPEMPPPRSTYVVCVCVCVCVSGVCVSVCLSVWYVVFFSCAKNFETHHNIHMWSII